MHVIAIIRSSFSIRNTFILGTLALIVSSCQQPAPGGTTATPDSTRVASAADAIVYVNSDTLLANYQFFKDLQAELEEQGKSLESQMSNRTANFQKQVSNYQQNAATMTPSERQSTEQNLGKAQQDLQAFQQKVSQDLMEAEQAANEKLHSKVHAFLQEYAALNDYKFVLTYSRSNNAVLFADSTLDVTDEVLNGLNAAYAKEQK